MTELIETPVLFGPEKNLFGMLTQPQARSSGVGILLLNTGVNHRIGPHRINVKIARRLALSGVTSLRFDLSGIGDSVASSSAKPFREQAIDDMKAALDHLQERCGIRTFLVYGVCSGADNALRLALNDPRISGLMVFDGPSFLTRPARIERKLRRMAAFPLNAAVRDTYPWWRDMRRALAHGDAAARDRTLGRIKAWLPGRQPVMAGSIFEADAPTLSPEQHEKNLLSLIDRGVALSLLYSVTYNSTDRNHGMLGQIAHSRVFSQAQYRFLQDVDHTATTLVMQDKLLGIIEDWVRSLAPEQPLGRGRAMQAPESTDFGALRAMTV